MDKNTITGLVLMALVMFGFFWLTKPSEAELKARQDQQEQAAANALKETKKKKCKMRNAHSRTWNMARNRKSWKKRNARCRTCKMARELSNEESDKLIS